MSTPEIIGPVIYCQTPEELAALSVAPFLSGQHARVKAMRAGGGSAEYVLQEAVSTTPDTFFVVPTADDSARQWVHSSIQEQAVLTCYTSELDLTQTQTVTIFPPLGYRLALISNMQWCITQRDGTVTTGPTVQVGTDNGISNLSASAVNNIGGNAVNSTPNFIAASQCNLDMSTNGVRLQITSGAVLGTATVFKARVRITMALAKF
jgi:hypothetical protein